MSRLASRCIFHFLTFTSKCIHGAFGINLVVSDENGLGARRVAKPVIQARAASRELVAAMATSAGSFQQPLSCVKSTIYIPGTVAKANVVRSSEAVRVWGVEARRPAGIHGACATAHAVDTLATVGDRRGKGLTQDKSLGCIDTRDGIAHKSELSVGGLEPVDHLLLGQNVDLGLRVCTSQNLFTVCGRAHTAGTATTTAARAARLASESLNCIVGALRLGCR